MALIYFYDSNDIDISQTTEGLAQTDHHWEYTNEPITPYNLNPQTEVISVFVSSEVTREIIDQLPNLKLIACRSTGYNNIDLAAAAERNITVTNVPTYGENTVAEYTFTLLLALIRKLPQTMGSFNNEVDIAELRGNDLYGKTIGVIGTGHIGQTVISIANGFGMKVIAYDLFPKKDLPKKIHFEYKDLDTLLKEADIVSLHAPLTPETKHILNKNKLAIMKPSAIVVNTARGELIDANALAQALSNKQLAGAALDVVEGEHLLYLNEEMALLQHQKFSSDTLVYSVAIMALHKMSNVILTPHNAFNTLEAIGRINSVTCRNIIDFWYGKVPNKINISTQQQHGKLILARHTESEWNATGVWTGKTDVHLTEKGFHEAALLGLELKDTGLAIDIAFCSEQIRTLETLEGMLDASGQIDVSIERTNAINERDYGVFTGKNKWEVRELVGEEEFNGIRRGWDHPIKGGETLRMVYERVLPFYKDKVLPLLKNNKNVLIVSHGNSIRALMKYLDYINNDEIDMLEMLFGALMIYDVNDEGQQVNKKMVTIDSPPPNA